MAERRVLVVGGSGGMTGAPLMASRAAMRAGAGIVWCGVPGRTRPQRGVGHARSSRVRCPRRPRVPSTTTRSPSVLDLATRFGALVVGPGLGRDERTAAAVRRLVAEAPVPLVLDADGLNALAGDLAPVRAPRSAPTVLTPHAGGVRAARRRAGRAPTGWPPRAGWPTRRGAVVLLKGRAR